MKLPYADLPQTELKLSPELMVNHARIHNQISPCSPLVNVPWPKRVDPAWNVATAGVPPSITADPKIASPWTNRGREHRHRLMESDRHAWILLPLHQDFPC